MALVLAGATCSNSHDLQLWRGMIVVLAYLFGSQCAMFLIKFLTQKD